MANMPEGIARVSVARKSMSRQYPERVPNHPWSGIGRSASSRRGRETQTDRRGGVPAPCDLSVFPEHAVGMPSGLCRIVGGSEQAWGIVGTLTFRGTLTLATLTFGTMPFGTLALGHARDVDVRETASGTPTFGTLSFGTLYFRTLTIGSMIVGNHPSVLVLGYGTIALKFASAIIAIPGRLNI